MAGDWEDPQKISGETKKKRTRDKAVTKRDIKPIEYDVTEVDGWEEKR